MIHDSRITPPTDSCLYKNLESAIPKKGIAHSLQGEKNDDFMW